MTYCTWADLAGLTGSTLASGDQTIVIAEVDREVNHLLQKYGLSGGSGDLVNAAALCIGKALLIERGLQTGDYGAQAGKAEDAVAQRKLAEEYIETYASLSTGEKDTIRVYKVNR